jgi:hypothetical protein
MGFFENLVENIPFNELSEYALIVVIVIIIVGFLAYQHIQNKKSIEVENIKKETELKRLEVVEDIAVDIGKNTELKDSYVGKISSKRPSRMKITIAEGSKINNSEVGKIDGK